MRSPCCLCVFPLNKPLLDKHIPSATNTHVTVEELLDAVFYMRSVSYQILHI
jgi:hypothetical protein